MNPKVVFFGGPDYGKSTVIGYMYSKAHDINMDNVEKKLKKELGANYEPDYLFSSLVNPHQAESLRRGERANSKQHEVKNIEIENLGTPVNITLIDTPGHDIYLSGRQLGMSMSDIGVFCLAVEKVLADDFAGIIFKYSDLYSEYHPNGKLIYLLTMFDMDIANYEEKNYHIACKKIKQQCRYVEVKHTEDVFGSDLSFFSEEIDVAAIIPVAVEFKTREKEGINFFAHNTKTSWYEGPTLIEAIQNQVHNLSMNYV